VAADPDNLLDAIGRSPIAMVISNPRLPDNPLEAVNAPFCTLTGYAEVDILGRNCRFLAGALTDPATTDLIRSAVRSRRSVLADIVNYRSDGRPFRNGVMITPLFGSDGELEWFLGSQVELAPDGAFLGGRQGAATEKVGALAPRQREVLTLMARGLLNKQIAWKLKISEKTVKMHRALLLERLGAATSADAIRLAVEAGL
jgi:DNA-binding CsgD family transcriptional regulator